MDWVIDMFTHSKEIRIGSLKKSFNVDKWDHKLIKYVAIRLDIKFLSESTRLATKLKNLF